MELKLEAVQQKALASLTPVRTVAADVRTRTARGNEESASLPRRLRFTDSLRGFRGMFLSLRWHLAGMSAAWALVTALNIDHSPSPVATMAKEKIPSPQQLLATLRENRRQIMELLDSPANIPESSFPSPSFVPKPRGEIPFTNSLAFYG